MNQRKKTTPPPRTGKWKSVNEDIIQPPEQFRDRYKPIPKPKSNIPFQMQNARRPPLPQTPKHEFNFDDGIFQTENQSLEKFKIIGIQSRENKKFKS